MTKYSFFFALCVTLHLFNLPSVLAETMEAPGHYQLFLSFDPENNQLTGTARISLEPGPRFSLSIAGINVTGTLLKDRSSRGKKLSTINDRLVVPASGTSRELYISYTKKVTNSLDNIIAPEGIALVSNWHPVPEVPMRFMNAQLKAISTTPSLCCRC